MPATPTRADERVAPGTPTTPTPSGPYDAALETGIDRPLTLRIGAAVHAGRLRAVLRGITGDVRFRADLAPITNVIDRHSKPTPP
ncbi:MAG: hypothetical protein NVS3B16_03480 [Vulcanimicrobiaceae bacterium]